MKKKDNYSKDMFRVMYYTGRDTVSAAKVHTYRDGVMTKSGDIELEEWRRLVLALIERNEDQVVLEQLKAEARAMPWIRTEKEALQKALEMYCSR